jgi:hypothetical protein
MPTVSMTSAIERSIRPARASGMAERAGRRLLLLAALAPLGACYTYAPVDTAVTPAGEVVAFDISDRGRVALSERFGPGLRRVEGRLARVEGDEMVLNVIRVAHLGGETSQWSGESVRLQREYVGQMSVRRLSKKRTFLAAGIATVSLAVFIASKGLTGHWFGSGSEGGPPDGRGS